MGRSSTDHQIQPKQDAKFGVKKRNPLKSLQEELSKVSKKITDYQSENNSAEKVPHCSEKEVWQKQ